MESLILKLLYICFYFLKVPLEGKTRMHVIHIWKSLGKMTLKKPVRENYHTLELHLIMWVTKWSPSELEAANGIITNTLIFLKFTLQQLLYLTKSRPERLGIK